MAFGFQYLEEILAKKQLTMSEVAQSLGVTLQAVSGWKSSNVIPGKRVIQLGNLFNLSTKDIDLLLGNEPLHFEFRTRGREVDESEVSNRTKVRAETIFERFFGNDHEPSTLDLNSLNEKIVSKGNDFLEVAQDIRLAFEIPSYQPVTHETLNLILERVGVRAFYLPFKAVNLTREGESEQTAALFKKDGKYSILVDSDRTIDEAHFDKLHEFIHILYGTLKPSDPSLEKLIDKICGELIYPKTYMLEKFFDGDISSRPITNKDKVKRIFFESNRNLRLILSPRGLALAMRDCELASANSELYKYLSTELHPEHRRLTVTYSKMGKMDFDFSNRDQLLSFFKEFEMLSVYFNFPLFQKLKKDLICNELSPADFADTFGMKLSDALVIAAIWKKEKHVSGT